jgi:hypothetical protein
MNQAIFRRRSGKALAAILLRADTQMRERSGSHSSSRTPRRESDTAGHTAEKVSELQEIRPVGGLPGSDRCGRVTLFFFHNVLDKKQQSAIINTRVLRLAVSPYWLKFYDENRHLPGWRFSLFTWSVITYPKI